MSNQRVRLLYLLTLHCIDKSDPKSKFNVPVPTHLKYFNVKGIDIKSVHCGYGYTIFIGSHPKLKNAFYGCGLNTDGQLGYQVRKCLHYSQHS